ncbi:MAG: hypothetical protein KDC44_01955 [Phaeodactylibacter sp.]|nr:hypothetical protein [Phaeodactylibacter sp.]
MSKGQQAISPVATEIRFSSNFNVGKNAPFSRSWAVAVFQEILSNALNSPFDITRHGVGIKDEQKGATSPVSLFTAFDSLNMGVPSPTNVSNKTK